jgi:NAD(P)-dependent dehydrogenase (short-subunit alcohol dehydrogenase family)
VTGTEFPALLAKAVADGVDLCVYAAVSREAPGYGASKAGMTMYLRGLALALRPHGVDVTTVRFGFVDTKMASHPSSRG